MVSSGLLLLYRLLIIKEAEAFIKEDSRLKKILHPLRDEGFFNQHKPVGGPVLLFMISPP